MGKKIKATCWECETVGYIPEDYTGKIKCPVCGCVSKRIGTPLSVTRQYFLDKLNEYEQQGYKKVSWCTAKDKHVCEECKSKEGKVYTIDEMRNIVLSEFCKADHFEQNCRCLILVHFEKTKPIKNPKYNITVEVIRGE